VKSEVQITCSVACDLLERALHGPTRKEILDEALRSGDHGDALRRLRAGMHTHVFKTRSGRLDLGRLVERLDARTREEGFHVLQSWDFTALRFTEENIPVLMLDYFVRTEAVGRSERSSLETLLDYYFLHVLALVVMRAWDEGDGDGILARVTELVGALQGPDGSGSQFVENAETLLMLAISHFHPEEKAYDRLIDKVRMLDEVHRTNFALVSAPVLGSHLRWGFWLMYDRDVLRMRNDNVGDYPWLLFALATLMRCYVRLRDESIRGPLRESVVEGLLSGLTADPWAFVGKPPPALSEHRSEYSELVELLGRCSEDLLDEFEDHRPSKERYSPVSLQFNFPNNTLVAMVSIALHRGTPVPLPLNALLARSDGSPGESPEALARALMDFSGSSPERLGTQGAMLVAYDPYTGLRSFTMTLDTLRKNVAQTPQ